MMKNARDQAPGRNNQGPFLFIAHMDASNLSDLEYFSQPAQPF